ncbi:uncharacterized protein LOC144141768 [Haemaphysalis longicornis]
MNLIPKLNKRPSRENLRRISLTSCVGKASEHVLMARWHDYLEDNHLYPEAMIGFRRSLCTYDAMIQLKHLIVDRDSWNARAIIDLDLQGAFDNVNHSAILN